MGLLKVEEVAEIRIATIGSELQTKAYPIVPASNLSLYNYSSRANELKSASTENYISKPLYWTDDR